MTDDPKRWLNSCPVHLDAVYRSPALAREALQAELDRLDLLILDPARVPGSVLIDFNANGWPNGWMWKDDPMWVAAEDRSEVPGACVLATSLNYDIRAYHLIPEEDPHGEMPPDKPLEDFVANYVRGGAGQ